MNASNVAQLERRIRFMHAAANCTSCIMLVLYMVIAWWAAIKFVAFEPSAGITFWCLVGAIVLSTVISINMQIAENKSLKKIGDYYEHM